MAKQLPLAMLVLYLEINPAKVGMYLELFRSNEIKKIETDDR